MFRGQRWAKSQIGPFGSEYSPSTIQQQSFLTVFKLRTRQDGHRQGDMQRLTFGPFAPEPRKRPQCAPCTRSDPKSYSPRGAGKLIQSGILYVTNRECKILAFLWCLSLLGSCWLTSGKKRGTSWTGLQSTEWGGGVTSWQIGFTHAFTPNVEHMS